MNRSHAGRQRLWPRSAVAAAAILSLVAVSATAWANAAAGRTAYDKGDFNRAMTEWQGAADHGDADGEFGLGNLYEFGAGDLEQDYNRAVYWYKKAAEQGNVEAEYRLGLLYAAGGDNFPSDLIEAYKWSSLAAQSHGVWGTLAVDFKNQLDRVTSPSQRAAGAQRADIWSQKRTASKTEATAAPAVQVPAVQALAAPAPTVPAKAAATGCPGWPFPTLRCTEQFPALAGQPASAPSVKSSPMRPAGAAPAGEPEPALGKLNKSLGQIDCAALRVYTSAKASAVISGTIPDADDRAMLVHLAARYIPDGRPEIAVAVVPPPLCRSLSQLNEMRLTGVVAEGGLEMRLNNGSSQLREGDAIRLEVRAPAYPVSLRIDYFSIDGRVLHLEPDNAEPPRLAADTVHEFGNTRSGEDWKAGGAPFGTEMIAVIATPEPLALGSRPRVEQAADYLRDLEGVLNRANASAERRNLAATLLVTTRGR